MTKKLERRYRLAAILSQIHRFFYVLFSGRFLSRRGGAHFLLLTTKGRLTQRMRTVPLLYVSCSGDLAVIGSFGGNPKAPHWLLNVRDDPNVKVQIRGIRHDGVARITTEEERLALWPKFVECFPGYERYQARTSRRFPIVIITPLQE